MKVLTFSAVAEAGTGLVLMVAPAIVVRLLLGAELADTGVVVGRCFGIALVGLSVACLPGRAVAAGGAEGALKDSLAVAGRSAPVRGMFLYNLLIALFLAYLGTVGHYGGILLWPAVALHGVVGLLLLRTLKEVRGKN